MTSVPSENPLLSIGFTIPFDRILPSHIEPAVAALLRQAESALEAIENSSESRTYDNTLAALESSTERLDVAMRVVGHLESVAMTPELRVAYNAVKPGVDAFYSTIPLRPKLWSALKAFAASTEAAALTGPKRRFLERTLDDFRRNGADLSEAGKARLEAISRELAEVTTRFSQNVLDATAEFELIVEDESRLAGLPASAVEAARQGASLKGKSGYRFTLQAPSLIPVLTYLDDRALREHVYRAYNSRATSGKLDNSGVIAAILRLRDEQAKLLGYASFPDFVLEDRMAKNARAARAFVADLTVRARAAFEREARELTAFRESLEGANAGPMAAWDVGYYAEKQRKALYDFDAEELRPYFSLNRVVEGLFEIAQRLYGVSIQPNEAMPVWHSDVRCYEIRDAAGNLLAAFYTDFFPREEKRGGAWMNALITGACPAGRSEPHLGLICANVSPAVGDRPALLTHQEVTTLFHEFGHLLHHCLSRVEVKSLAGIHVAWDFVELPSQIMENWCWEREALDTFARHYETGASIPAELFAKMKRARTYREATATMRQLGFAEVDLALHTDYRADRDGDVTSYARSVMQRFSPVEYPPDYAMIASFTHLFGSSVGYGGGYYSYKWAEVLDADAFSRFLERGVFSREVGREFLDKLLSRGNSDDPMNLYRDFMGREPKLDALLLRAGLLAPTGDQARAT